MKKKIIFFPYEKRRICINLFNFFFSISLSRTMSVPSIDTDNTSSTIIEDDDDDDNMSIVVNDSSDTTVATQTSTSWHSVISNVQINNNLFLRSHSINTWLKICSIEPDIRLTTAQEWKLRTCIRRFISLCNHPLKISCIKIKESTSFIDQVNFIIQNYTHSFFFLSYFRKNNPCQ